MNRQPIKTRSGKILGWITTEHDGKQKLTDFNGRILGTYTPKDNKTRDFYGRIMGTGNMLTMFLNFNE